MPEIDPREFGHLEAEVKALRGQVDDLSRDVRSLLEMANKGKGGLWTAMSMSGMVGGMAVWVVEHLMKR